MNYQPRSLVYAGASLVSFFLTDQTWVRWVAGTMFIVNFIWDKVLND